MSENCDGCVNEWYCKEYNKAHDIEDKKCKAYEPKVLKINNQQRNSN